MRIFAMEMKKTQTRPSSVPPVPKARTARDSITNNMGAINLDFIQLTSKLLNDIIHTYAQGIDRMKQELVLIENSRLHINRKGTHVFFRSRPFGEDKDVSITHDRNRIHLLARRAYLENTISAMTIELQRLQRKHSVTQASCFELKRTKLLNKYASAGLDLYQIIYTKEQLEWINEPYTPNPFYPEDLQHPTTGNILMRSKSEKTIGNKIEAFAIPYRYDDFVNILTDPSTNNLPQATRQPFRKSYFADFKVPNLLGGITVHEHLGSFQMDQYSANAFNKMNDYHNFTVIEIPGRPVKNNEFIWSFESDLQDIDSLDRLIAKLLLPGFF